MRKTECGDLGRERVKEGERKKERERDERVLWAVERENEWEEERERCCVRW